jgi:excisionase family DNA binding protein
MVRTAVEHEQSVMLTLKQVCDVLQVHHNTLRRWIAAGRVPAYRLGPRGDLRLKQNDLDMFIEQMRIDGNEVRRLY